MAIDKYSRKLYIPPSFCDLSGKLSIAKTFALFMDIASEHAELTGIGTHAMARKGLFWLTTKTKIHFNRRPEMMEIVEASTWPQEIMQARVTRDYELQQNGELLISGKTEWAVLEINTGRLHNIHDGVCGEGTPVYEKNILPEPFSKIKNDFSSDRLLGEYTINSQDTDFGGHTNNAVYPRIFLGMYNGKELKSMHITDMEIIFKAPCFEGDVVSVYERKNEDSIELGMFNKNNDPVAFAKIN